MTEVYKSIAAVQGELAKTGIAKNRKNSQGSGYMFRGIDDVYAAIAPLLAAHELCVIPRMIERTQIDRVSQKGGALFYVTVKAEFDFVSAKDGSKHTACTFGEAMDSGDKATNKAMSAAYKYAAFMTFAIPTEGDNDADSVTHDVAPREQKQIAGMPPSKCSAADVARIETLAKEADKAIGAITDAYLVKDLADLTADQAAAAIKRLKLTIDQRNIDNEMKEAA